MKLAQDIYERLQQRLLHHCKEIDSARREMAKLADAYNRYRDLDCQIQDHKERAFTILKMLGPEKATHGLVSENANTVKEKFGNPIHADDLKTHLSTWRAVREYLYEAGESKLGDIQKFLTWLGMENMTRQRIESALKRHPNTFQVIQRNHERFVELKPKK